MPQFGYTNPALRGLKDSLGRPLLSSAASGQDGVGQSVYEHNPGMSLPFIAGPGENQSGLDFIHDRLKGPNTDFDMTQQQDTQNEWRKASLGGDESPMAAALAAEALKRYQIDAPTRAQGEAGRWNLQQQQEQSRGGIGQAEVTGRGQLAVEQERQRGAESIQDKFAELQKTLSGQGNVAAVTLPGQRGGGSVRFQNAQRVPPALLQTLTAARQNFTRMGGDESSTAALNAAIQGVLSNYPATPEVKNDISRFLSDPDTSNMTDISQIMQTLVQKGKIEMDDLSLQEKEEYQSILNMLHGGY